MDFIKILLAILSYRYKTMVFALKVFLAVALVFLLLSLFSCSSSRPIATETVATESITAHEISRDSISSALALQADDSRYLDIEDLSILFYPPAPDVPAVPDSATTMPTPVTPVRAYPMLLNIGSLSSGNASKTALKAEDSRLKTEDSAISQASESKDTEQRIRDPTPCRWPVFLVLGCALVIMIYTGRQLYRTEA